MRHSYRIWAALGLLIGIAACVTERKKGEVKGLKLAYHNITAHYNGFFNASVLVQEATDKLKGQYQDNYNAVLPIYPEAAVDNPQAVAPDLDKAIEKVAVVATFHRPSHWVDDCYLLMGEAHFLKKNYEAAEETFGYLTEVYNPELKLKLDPKARKAAAEEARKEKEKARKEKAKEQQKAREERQEAQKKAQKEAEEQRKQEALNRKKSAEEAQKERKEATKTKELTLEERNEARRKAAEQAAAERRKARENTNQNVPTIAEATPPSPEPSRVTVEKTGSNGTPVTKTDAEKKSSKKPTIKPKKYVLKHRPCYQEGVIWLARTYIERKNYNDAAFLLDNMLKNPRTFYDVRHQARKAYAHLYLVQENYEMAIPMLEAALASSKKKKEKARLAFILAQAYQIVGNSNKAYALFDRVLKYSPVYEMEFNARLNMALNTTTAADQTIAMLEKMGKNDKNLEYGDKIYFTLAQIALKNNDKPLAIDYLRRALYAEGRPNPKQKAEAYYLLGQLMFESGDFVAARYYYDSTTLNMPKNDPRYADAERYATSLFDIAKNLETIALQDSLIKLAALSPRDLRTFAANQKKARLAAEKQANKGKSAFTGDGFNEDMASGIPANMRPNFFGYYKEKVRKGQTEFEKKWGSERKLEDNWRRSNKRGSGDIAKIDDVNNNTDLTDKEFEEITKDIPKNKTDIAVAEEKVAVALFALGTLYYDKLKYYERSAATLEDYLKRFPNTSKELEAFYYLYLAYTDAKNPAKARLYYEKIQEKHPLSTYAQLLRDPQSAKPKDKLTVEGYYDALYQAFERGEYQSVMDQIKQVPSRFGINTPLNARFALLNAICIGRLQGKAPYVLALKTVVAQFGNTPEEKKAKEMIRILESEGNPTVDNNPPKMESSDELVAKFSSEVTDKLHYVIILLPRTANVEDEKIVVSDFNAKYNRLEDLKISSVILSTESEIPMLVVRKFNDKAAAVTYTEGASKNPKDFVKGAGVQMFAITQDNYRELLRQKSTEAYAQFYQYYYK